MYSMKLSIIIPIYNVKEYLGRCVDSLFLQQDVSTDYEVIFVNDGSTDGSDIILQDKISKADTAIYKLYNKENGGLSSARNFGISQARGEYMWFVDSDDWIAINSLKIILRSLDGENVDILRMTQYYKSDGNINKLKGSKIPDGLYNGGNLLKYHCETCAQFNIVNSVFWKQNNFKFYEGIIHEDTELTYRLLYSAKSIKCISDPLYYHFERIGSIMMSNNPNRFKSLMIVLRSNMNFFVTKVQESDKSHYMKYIEENLYFLCNSAIITGKDAICETNTFLNNNDGMLEAIMKYGSTKARLIVFIMNLSKPDYFKGYIFLKKMQKFLGLKNNKNNYIG